MKVEPKQEYRAPKLVVYGDLSQITNGSPTGSKNDHTGGKSKSS